MPYEFEDEESSVILIAPMELSSRLARSAGDVSMRSFRSLADLDRWRRSNEHLTGDIRADVLAALHEIGSDLDALSLTLRDAFETFAARRSVPNVGEIERLFASRRSLYRLWTNELGEAPSRFLRRVRLIQAERLLHAGVSAKEAALRVGFGSVNMLRRLLNRRHAAAPR